MNEWMNGWMNEWLDDSCPCSTPLWAPQLPVLWSSQRPQLRWCWCGCYPGCHPTAGRTQVPGTRGPLGNKTTTTTIATTSIDTRATTTKLTKTTTWTLLIYNQSINQSNNQTVPPGPVPLCWSGCRSRCLWDTHSPTRGHRRAGSWSSGSWWFGWPTAGGRSGRYPPRSRRGTAAHSLRQT